ncbi:Rpn family recombination-promoting nuclease/putative transposase [uncultured Treponema sp.]|uniref:Rpn family recombination-promoting nuclease/putative transposase n=1 Tax=uncultured Treponema sp. TaxID=162155 RepID=UPI0025E665FF|nr:Rpn family recombination-promoting nuclease/putative transposase [uncultured Treponema sp.]
MKKRIRNKKRNRHNAARERKPKRTYRDSLFRTIFGGKDERSKRWLLSLYNALSGKNHTNIEDLEITTLEDVIYVSIKNDLSFLIHSQMCLYEHQSTVNPNMPLRGMLYFSQLYQQYIDKHKKNLYGSVLVKIPAPQFIVFYNGNAEQADIVEYKLSDAFLKDDELKNTTEIPQGDGQAQNAHKNVTKFEWTATVININKNHNESLSKNCEPLYHYREFVNQVKENLSSGMSFDSAVNEAVDFAIKSDFLEGFFRENRMKILDDIYTEFDQESYDETLRNDGRIENAIANAKNALAMGLSPEQAAQITSLPLEQVLALKEELAREVVSVTN